MKKLLIAFAGCAILLTGCRAMETPSPGASPSETPSASTSTTPSPSPSATPSPTGTLSPDQQAALDARMKGEGVLREIERDPTRFSEKEIRQRVASVTMEPLRTSTIAALLQMRKDGVRETGDVKVLSVKVGRAEKLDGGALRVVITRCLDQRALRVVDKKGVTAPGDRYRYPEWQLQESAMRKAKGSKTWLQAGTRPVSIKKCG